MGWLEIFVVLAIWQTVKGWLRWKRSGRVGRSSRRYSRSSQPIAARPTLPELDPDRTLHQARCRWCRARMFVPLRETRLEADPWRVTWICGRCGRRTRALVADELVELLLGQDRCYGMAISRRECEDWALADLDDLAVAVEEELL